MTIPLPPSCPTSDEVPPLSPTIYLAALVPRSGLAVRENDLKLMAAVIRFHGLFLTAPSVGFRRNS